VPCRQADPTAGRIRGG